MHRPDGGEFSPSQFCKNALNMKVLMVCLGNICRSPLAEGILRQLTREAGLAWHVDSAGTGSWHIGQQPDPRSVDIARRHGLDITDQRGRQFNRKDFERFDLILTMDQDNYRDVRRLARTEGEREKVQMIMNLVHPGEDRPVPDPYWDDDGFEQVYRMLEHACAHLVEQARNGQLPEG